MLSHVEAGEKIVMPMSKNREGQGGTVVQCRWYGCAANGTTSMPKTVPRFVLDKVRQVPKSEVQYSNVLF